MPNERSNDRPVGQPIEPQKIFNYIMQNPKLAFIDEAIHPKSAFINEALCVENEIKHELKTIAIT